jgi:hypothetical protein
MELGANRRFPSMDRPMKDPTFVNFEVDPAIEATLSASNRRRGDRQLPAKERKAKTKERAKNEERKGKRASYDLPPEMIKAIARIADEVKAPASQLVALAISQLLDQIVLHKLDLTDYLIPAKSPRYDYRIALDKIRKIDP